MKILERTASLLLLKTSSGSGTHIRTLECITSLLLLQTSLAPNPPNLNPQQKASNTAPNASSIDYRHIKFKCKLYCRKNNDMQSVLYSWTYLQNLYQQAGIVSQHKVQSLLEERLSSKFNYSVNITI